MEFHDYPNHKTMIVMDGRRPLARARHIHSECAWLLKAYGFLWTDKRAHQPGVFGIVDARFLLIKSKREARKILKALAA